MTRFKKKIQINASIQEVWKVVSNPWRYLQI